MSSKADDQIGKTMRAAVIRDFGGPNVAQSATVSLPRPGPGEVLIGVQAAAINAIDSKTRRGQGVPVSAFPAILGWDVSGVVVDVGPEATCFRPGDSVFGMVGFPNLVGCHAEFVVAAETQLVRRPANVSPLQASAAMAMLTAWQSLHQVARVEPGQRVLVHGGAGGVGHIAVQLAHLAGAEVIATASAANSRFLKALGANEVVDYRQTALAVSAKDVDLVIDTRGGSDFYELLHVLAEGGCIVTLLGEATGQRDATQRRGVSVGYAYVKPDADALGQISPLLENNSLRLEVQQVFSLDELEDAHRISDAGHVRGVLVVSPGGSAS